MKGVRSLQERFEASVVGRSVISVFVVVAVFSIIVINLPGSSPIRTRLLKKAQPFLNATGLDQGWGVFAPDPRRAVYGLHAVVEYDDGSSATWRFPTGDDLIGGYWDYRWRKWMENVNDDGNGATLRKPAALWAAKETAHKGAHPIRVQLFRSIATLRPPGEKGKDPLPATETVIYTLTFRHTAGAS